jgi:3-hydroxymyristoyl/3-hydroxydecanoyl-(acyl carrier protein) dehydratase
MRIKKEKMGFNQILVKAQHNDGESTAIINEDNIFLDDNHQLSSTVLVEYINQLIAAIKGYNSIYNNETALKGLFVGLQEATFLQTVNSSDVLNLRAFVTEEVSQVTFIQGIIFCRGQKIAELVTKIYEVKDISEFNLLTNNEQVINNQQVIKDNKNIESNLYQPPTYLDSSMCRKLFTYLNDIMIDSDCISFNIACHDDFEMFSGHFPGSPILPGIALLEIAKLALELFTKTPITIKNIKKMKISGVVFPRQVIFCNVKIDGRDDSMLSFSAGFKDMDGKDISRFNGYCEPTSVCNEGRK